MALKTIKDVSFAYDGGTVVSGLDFEVSAGDYLCVVGENGSGKSTLIKGLLGLKAPQSGQIVTGENLKPREIGYLPQQTASQRDFPASVYEVVLSGRLGTRGLAPFYSRADKLQAEKSLARLNISDLKAKCYGDLSGGQQQRVLLARALCAATRLLVLDEPAAGLDPLVRQELYGIIDELNRESGLAIIMVSHDVHSAVKYAGKILHLRNTQAFFGTTADYLKSSIAAGFLGGMSDD